MVRSTKVEKIAAKAEGVSTPVAPAPVAAAAAAPAAPKEKKASTKKATTPKETVAAAPVPAPVPEPVAAAPVVAEPVVLASSESIYADINADIKQIGAIYFSLKERSKNFGKSLAREKKLAEKNSKVKKAKKTGENKNRKPSGFTKPTRISDELAAFLGKPSGTEMSRIDAAKEVINYIKTNNLKDKTNGRIIHPDQTLSRLLKTTDKDQLHFFNLQSFMKPHFFKAEPAVATA